MIVMKQPRMLMAIDDGTSMQARPASRSIDDNTMSRALRTRENSLFIFESDFIVLHHVPEAASETPLPAALRRIEASGRN